MENSSDGERVTDRPSDGSPEQSDLARAVTEPPFAAAFNTIIKQKRRAGAEAKFRRFALKLDKRERGLLSCSSIFGYTFSGAVKKVMSTIDGTTDTTTDTTTATGLSPAPAPSAAKTPVDVVRDTMAGVKGQPKLIAALETIAKASVRQKQRHAATPGDADKPNRNMVFHGEAGTFKTSAAKAFANAMYKLGLVEKPTVRVVDKRYPMEKGKSIEEQVAKTFEKADGGVIFWDEIHQRTDPKFVQAFLAWTDPDGENGGRVVTIIAGYAPDVKKWLELDGGLSRRFPRQGRVEFEKLKPSVLYEFGLYLVAKKGFQLAASAHDAMRACAKVVYDYVPPENAGGMKSAVQAMKDKHDANDEYALEDVCITAADIFAAVPAARGIELDPSEFIAPPAPSPQAEEQAVVVPGPCASVDMDVEPASPPKLEKLPSIVDEVVDAFKQRRAQGAAQESYNRQHRGKEEKPPITVNDIAAKLSDDEAKILQDAVRAPGPSGKRPASVRPEDEAARSDSESSGEDEPFSKRTRRVGRRAEVSAAAPSSSTSSSRKRNHSEPSSEAVAPEASNKVKAIVRAIDMFYEVDAKANSISRKDFFKGIIKDDNYVKTFDEDHLKATINTYNAYMNTLLEAALGVIAARVNSVTVEMQEDSRGKNWVVGLRLRDV